MTEDSSGKISNYGDIQAVQRRRFLEHLVQFKIIFRCTL